MWKALSLLTIVLVWTQPAAGLEKSGFVASHIQVQVSESQKVEATLRLPARLSAGKKVPVLLIFGGFESAAQVLDLVKTASPVALAGFDYPYSSPREFRFPEGLKALPELRSLFPKTEYGIRELVSELSRRPEIDPTRIILVGASFGAPFAIAAAAHDPRISGVVLVHGFGRAPETLESVILRSWLPRYGWVARPLAWGISRLGWLYLGLQTPEKLARKFTSQQRVLLVTAEKDSFIPRESSDSLWRAIQESSARSARVLMRTDHLMPGSDQLIAEIVRMIEKWMQGMPVGTIDAPAS